MNIGFFSEHDWSSEKLSETFELNSKWKVSAPANISGICKHIIIQCRLYFCSGSLCKMESVAFKIIVEYSEISSSAIQTILQYAIKT